MTLDDIVAAVKTAHDAAKQAPSGGSHTPLRIRGAGSKDFYGGLLAGEVLDVSGHRGIVAYEPTELYITAKCGTPLAEIGRLWPKKARCWPSSRRTFQGRRSAVALPPVCPARAGSRRERYATSCWA